MTSDRMRIARLDDQQREAIRSMETRLRCRIVALEPAPALAPLSPEQVGRLQLFERELCATLVAYEPSGGFQLANTSASQRHRLEELEKELDLVLVAYERAQPRVAAPALLDEPLAALPEDDYDRLQALEEKLGVVLMAYGGPSGSAGATRSQVS